MTERQDNLYNTYRNVSRAAWHAGDVRLKEAALRARERWENAIGSTIGKITDTTKEELEYWGNGYYVVGGVDSGGK